MTAFLEDEYAFPANRTLDNYQTFKRILFSQICLQANKT